MNRVRLWTCVALAVAVAGGGLLGMWSLGHDVPTAERAHRAAANSLAQQDSTPRNSIPEPMAVRAGDSVPMPSEPRVPDVHELRAACSSLIGELTAECESALERRFVDMWAHSPSSLVPGVTHGELFTLDESTYVAVRTALARPECRVPPGRMRTDLRQTCAADAMARLALLHRACFGWIAQDPDGSERLRLETRLENERWDVEPDNAEWLDQEDYLKAREQRELNAFERSWEYRKCRAMPAGALEWRGFRLEHVADGAYYMSNERPRQALSESEARRVALYLYMPLLEAAARLGSELAFERLLTIKTDLQEKTVADLVAAMEARNPTLAQAKLSELVHDDITMLAHAMAAQMLAPLQGLDVDWSASQWQELPKWHWMEDGEWVDSHGRLLRLEAHERHEATVEAQRIVARIAAQQGWDADGLDWSQVAAPDDRY